MATKVNTSLLCCQVHTHEAVLKPAHTNEQNGGLIPWWNELHVHRWMKLTFFSFFCSCSRRVSMLARTSRDRSPKTTPIRSVRSERTRRQTDRRSESSSVMGCEGMRGCVCEVRGVGKQNVLLFLPPLSSPPLSSSSPLLTNLLRYSWLAKVQNASNHQHSLSTEGLWWWTWEKINLKIHVIKSPGSLLTPF